MGVFFNGRLWVSPATMSVVDDSAMYNKNLSVGNVLALLGKSSGGQPQVPLRFGSAAEAKAVLRDGELLRAVEKAFDPSAQTVGPSTIICMRVDPATQSSLTLRDANSLPSIDLVSTDYGLHTNQIMVKVETASGGEGKKITTQFGEAYYSADNVMRNAFSIESTSGETGEITVTDNQVNLGLYGSQDTLELSEFPTIQALVDKINTLEGYAAVVLDSNGSRPSLNGLDGVTASVIPLEAADGYESTPLVVTAHRQAIIDWLNGAGEGFLTASRSTNPGEGNPLAYVPVNADFVYLSGGTLSTTLNSDWSDCFTALQAEDVQWVVPVTSSPAQHAMAETHCAFMSNIARKERRCIVGGASGATDAEAILAAKALGSDRASYTHLGFYDYDASGALVLFEPYILAAQLAGMFAGVNPGTALTNKSIKVRGMERKLRNPTDTDRLILGGVLCVEDTPRGYRVVKSISTWLVSSAYNRVEVSVGVALDFVSRNVRDILDDLRGAKGTPVVLGQAVSRVGTTLAKLSEPEPSGPGILVGDAENPPYKNISASLEGDVLAVTFSCSPVCVVNYIPISIYAAPFSGSAKA